MKLHQNSKLFKDAVVVTAQQMNIPPLYVEKDYWVTYALYTIFKNEIGKDTVFKGGTALAKCFDMIERFSEDIDLVVIKHEGESDNKLKRKLQTISGLVSGVMPEVEVESITRKFGMIRKTAHSYKKEFTGEYGQVRDAIIVEASWLGHSDPFTTTTVCSFVGEMMIGRGQTTIAEENGLMPFEVRVLEPVRTLCEKIMSLVRFSYTSEPIEDLKKKIRHTYDLHQLLRQKEYADFLQSPTFEEMLLNVAADDVKSFKNNKAWLQYYPSEALIFKNTDAIWTELRQEYNGAFKNLVYGVLPDDREVLKTLKKIQKRLKDVTWTIQIQASFFLTFVIPAQAGSSLRCGPW